MFISRETFRKLIKIIFVDHKGCKSIDVPCSLNSWVASDTSRIYWKVDFPASVEEFNRRLSSSVRYNTHRFPKKINRDLGSYKISRISAEETDVEIIHLYSKWKALNLEKACSYEGNSTYIQRKHITWTYLLCIGEKIEAILFLAQPESTDIPYLHNLTYNPEYAKYSLGSVLYYHMLCDLIQRGIKTIFLYYSTDEYKRRFNGTGIRVYNCMIERNLFLKNMKKILRYIKKIAKKMIMLCFGQKNIERVKAHYVKI
jgi:hypothetical protein